jgi:hypothetical protein
MNSEWKEYVGTWTVCFAIRYVCKKNTQEIYVNIRKKYICQLKLTHGLHHILLDTSSTNNFI